MRDKICAAHGSPIEMYDVVEKTPMWARSVCSPLFILTSAAGSGERAAGSGERGGERAAEQREEGSLELRW